MHGGGRKTDRPGGARQPSSRGSQNTAAGVPRLSPYTHYTPVSPQTRSPALSRAPLTARRGRYSSATAPPTSPQPRSHSPAALRGPSHRWHQPTAARQPHSTRRRTALAPLGTAGPQPRRLRGRPPPTGSQPLGGAPQAAAHYKTGSAAPAASRPAGQRRRQTDRTSCSRAEGRGTGSINGGSSMSSTWKF